MRPMWRVTALVLAALNALAGVAAAADTKTTGQWILNGTLVAILLGAIATWWVVRRYRPSS